MPQRYHSRANHLQESSNGTNEGQEANAGLAGSTSELGRTRLGVGGGNTSAGRRSVDGAVGRVVGSGRRNSAVSSRGGRSGSGRSADNVGGGVGRDAENSAGGDDVGGVAVGDGSGGRAVVGGGGDDLGGGLARSRGGRSRSRG